MNRRKSRLRVGDGCIPEECCVLCRSSADDPAMFGEKVAIKEHNMSVHYLCLLTSSGIYQRGKEDEGIFGFMVDDIKQEVRRSSRLACSHCKKKGACVGCSVKSCRRMVHFACSSGQRFLCQFTGLFPSFCCDHSPTQSLSVSSELSRPQSCSICLESIEPLLCYSVLKCPSCHASWFHRECVQRQAHSAGLFFFRCTLCNNKENFQEEMLRMGIFIPERDASWELEPNAYSELLEVYQNCDAVTCLCSDGRSHSAKTGWFGILRCCLCGSKGTHRKCAGLKSNTRDWACSDCKKSTDGKASLVASPQGTQRRSLLSKRHLSPLQTSVTAKRSSLSLGSRSPQELLQSLLPQLRPVSAEMEMCWDEALAAGLELVRRPDFDPTHTLTVRFKDSQGTMYPSSLLHEDTAKQYFLKKLTQQIQESLVFEGPDGSKNLSLNSQALHEDLYFDVGCLLALSLVHGGPPLGFFSPALYQCLFNYPANQPLSVNHMTPGTHFTHQVNKIVEAKSLSELMEVTAASRQYLELAGCSRVINQLQDKEALVEDLVNFSLITRMQLPLQRFREGLQTLGIFEQVQLFPSAFCSIFCKPPAQLTAQSVSRLFTIDFSEQDHVANNELPIIAFWRHFLLECEVGRSSISLQDLLCFATGSTDVPAVGFFPPPFISFLHTASSSPSSPSSCSSCSSSSSSSGEQQEMDVVDEGLFPQRVLSSKHLLLPVSSSYPAFKSAMEQAISHHVHLLPTDG